MLTRHTDAQFPMEVTVHGVNEKRDSMSINWLQPALGVTFIAIWLIVGQIVVGARGDQN